MSRKLESNNLKTVPRLVQFDKNQGEYDRLDEIQALQTALCFLCTINADVGEVHSFLLAHPEALLLEGAGRGSLADEESATFIVLSRTCCTEVCSCRQNRQAILDECLSHNFMFYRQQQLEREEVPKSQWADNQKNLLLIEQDIRHWRREESTLQQQLLELLANDQSAQKHKTSVWSCSGGAKRAVNDRMRLERSMTLIALQERHNRLLFEIRRARQLQFRLLKRTFHGVQRHVCVHKSLLEDD